MKKIALLLLMAGFMFTASNLYNSVTKVSAKVSQMGDYNDHKFGCPEAGSDCEHLGPVVLK